MHKDRSTNVFALLVITIIAVGTTRFLLSKIAVLPKPQLMQQSLSITTEDIQQNDESLVMYQTLLNQGWKSYRNEDMGIEFAYPNDWDLKEYKTGISLLFPSKDEIQKDLVIGISVSENGNINNLSPDQWEKENVDPKALEKQTSSKSINIDKKIAFYAEYFPSKSESLYGDYYFNHVLIDIFVGHNIYSISGKKLTEIPDERLTSDDFTAAHQYESDFSQILESLHFI
jgi:hypothetical protein